MVKLYMNMIPPRRKLILSGSVANLKKNKKKMLKR